MKKKIIISTLLIAIMLSCRDNDLLPLNYHDVNGENGSYLRTVSIPSPKLDLTKFSSTYFEIVYEAGVVDVSKFESVSLTLQFNDNTPNSPDNNVATYTRKPVSLSDLPASSFTIDPTSNLPRRNFKISGVDILKALNLPVDSVTFGDTFDLIETINYDGQSWSFSNTSADLTGGAFYGSPFIHTIGTGDPLSISISWDGGKGYCKSVDLDVYLSDSNGDEVDNFVAASSACPEKTEITLSQPNGSYFGDINPYQHSVEGDIPVTVTFSQPGKANVVLELANPIKTSDAIWYDNDGAVVFVPVFKVVKLGPDFDIFDADGNLVGSFKL